jgi:uncharacterized phage-associated protein
MDKIRFRFHPEKAFAFIHHMVSEGEIDLHSALKACYFADKAHLNKFYKPIFGATYQAMRYGPVPLEIYDMMKGEPLWLAEVAHPSYLWQLNGFKLNRISDEKPNYDDMSQTNLACLNEALTLSKSLTFNQRTELTHQADWANANLGIMSYEDMLEENDEKSFIISNLQETARFMRL